MLGYKQQLCLNTTSLCVFPYFEKIYFVQPCQNNREKVVNSQLISHPSKDESVDYDINTSVLIYFMRK